MKRSGFLKQKTPLRIKGVSDTADIKEQIQDVVRQIVIARDGGCILRNIVGPDLPSCNGFRKDGQLILQADHLITRSNAATFADTRLIVCLCKGHHGWKSLGSNRRKAEYDILVKGILSLRTPERVKLWEACERDSWKPTRKFTMDWRIELAALKQEYAQMQKAA